MDRSILVFFALSICIAQCATIQGNDKPNEPIQKRDKRSCHYCEEGSYNGPVYHSLQYSGLARNDDGTAQGVFSGAAAAALPSYSLASSVANAGADGAHATGADIGTGAALDTGAALGTGAAYGIGAALGTVAGLGTGAALRNGAAYNAGAALGTGAAYGAGAALGTGAALASGPALGIGVLGAGAYNGARVADQTAAYGGGRLTERSVDFGVEQPVSIGHAIGGKAGFGTYGQNKFSGSGSYKEEHFSFHNDGGKSYGGHGEARTFGSNGANSFGSQSSGSAGYGGNEQQVQQSAFDHGHGDKHDIELLKEDGQQQLQSSDHGQWQQGHKFSGPSQSSSSYSAASSGAGCGESPTGASQGAFNGASSSRYQHGASGSGFSNAGASIGTSSSGSGYGVSGARGFGVSDTGSFSDRAEQASIGTSGSGSGYGVSGAGFGVSGTGSSSSGAEQASIGTGGSGSKYGISGFGASSEGLSSGQASVGTGVSGSGYRASEGGSSSAGAGFESSLGTGSQYGQTSGYRGSGVGHAALNGALKLASQGLQTAQDGCSTCGRSSYAFSNAKSKTGDAVSVSIGG